MASESCIRSQCSNFSIQCRASSNLFGFHSGRHNKRTRVVDFRNLLPSLIHIPLRQGSNLTMTKARWENGNLAQNSSGKYCYIIVTLCLRGNIEFWRMPRLNASRWRDDQRHRSTNWCVFRPFTVVFQQEEPVKLKWSMQAAALNVCIEYLSLWSWSSNWINTHLKTCSARTERGWYKPRYQLS